MRCWSNPERARDARTGSVLRATLLVLSTLAIPGSASSEPGFRVLDASSRLTDGVHRVDVNVDFAFSEDAIEAMRNGVAITVSVRAMFSG